MSEGTEGATGTEETTEGQQTGSIETTETSAKTPEWYEKELKKVREEAASTRVKLRETESKLTSAKTPEEFEAAREELTAAREKAERELMVERAGRGLPDELRSLLKGDTEAELQAHAAVLMKFAPAQEAPPEKLGGGLNAGGGGGDDFDVKEIARKARLGRL